MKTAMWIVGALAAFLASSVDADGICYDHSLRDVKADMETLKQKGFSHVRTYESANGIAAKVAASGLRSMLGIPYGRGDVEPHAVAAVEAAKSGTVDFIMIGNENLRGSVPGDFIAYIDNFKKRLQQNGVYNVKVGTVQRSTEFMTNIGNLGSLVAVCDVVGVNIHPFFTPGASGNPMSVTWNQWTGSKANVGDKLILTETGWPSSGDYAGNKGDIGLEASYLQAYKSSPLYNSLSPSTRYYFQAFDTTYKLRAPHNEPTYEGFFGLFNEGDGKPKVEGAVGAPTPAPTPEPTTPAPTTVAPASNSTSGSADNEEGVSSSSASLGDAGEVGEEASAGVDLGIANNEEATADFTPSPEEGTETGDNTEKEGAAEANTQSSTGSSTAGVIVVILMGCAAVGGAFAFIYKARQKAAEVERAESKSFDMTVTPGGACVL